MEESQSQIKKYSLVKSLIPQLGQEKYNISLKYLMVLENQSVLKNDGPGASLKGFPRTKSEIIRTPRSVMMLTD